MRTETVVSRVLNPLKVSIHATRLKCLCRVIVASLVVGRLALTALGRALDSGGKTKHAIKRVDVLLGNGHLVEDAEAVQLHLAGLMAKESRPVLLVDWTDIGSLWTTLAVTYVSEGRGLVVCWETHPRARQNSPRAEANMLTRIARLLPPGAIPIFVTDAGFRGSWMKQLQKRGWDFVGRVRGRVNVRQGNEDWRDVTKLWPQARCQPKDLGVFELARQKRFEARLVVVQKQQKRRSKKLPRVGRRKKRNIKSAREPLVLATSLMTASASEIASLYRLRWQIEMTFRDQKCTRFGLGLGDVRTKKLERACAYMLLAVLAHYVSLVIGATAEQLGLARHFQANTAKCRVLAWPRLGCEVLRKAAPELAQIAQRLLSPVVLIDHPKCGDP